MPLSPAFVLSPSSFATGCVVTGSSVQCSCKPGYTGAQCERWVLPLHPAPRQPAGGVGPAGGGALQVWGPCRWGGSAGEGALQVGGLCRWGALRGVLAGGVAAGTWLWAGLCPVPAQSWGGAVVSLRLEKGLGKNTRRSLNKSLTSFLPFPVCTLFRNLRIRSNRP